MSVYRTIGPVVFDFDVKPQPKQTNKRLWPKLTANDQNDRWFMCVSKFGPLEVVCICPGAVYMYRINLFKNLLFENC